MWGISRAVEINGLNVLANSAPPTPLEFRCFWAFTISEAKNVRKKRIQDTSPQIYRNIIGERPPPQNKTPPVKSETL